MTQAIDGMKQLVAKKNQPADGSQDCTSASTFDSLGKTLKELVSVVTELKKGNDAGCRAGSGEDSRI